MNYPQLKRKSDQKLVVHRKIYEVGLIPIQNSKFRKPYVARVFEFGSVAKFWRIGITQKSRNSVIMSVAT